MGKMILTESGGNGQSIEMVFPTQYNVGDSTTAAGLATPTATRTVKIKVSSTTDGIYIDYLFDVADMQAAGKYFIYDPTVTETTGAATTTAGAGTGTTVAGATTGTAATGTTTTGTAGTGTTTTGTGTGTGAGSTTKLGVASFAKRMADASALSMV